MFVLAELFPPELQYTHLGYVCIFLTSNSNKIFWHFNSNEDQIPKGKIPHVETHDKFLALLPASVQANKLLTQLPVFILLAIFKTQQTKTYTQKNVFSHL